MINVTALARKTKNKDIEDVLEEEIKVKEDKMKDKITKRNNLNKTIQKEMKYINELKYMLNKFKSKSVKKQDYTQDNQEGPDQNQ